MDFKNMADVAGWLRARLGPALPAWDPTVGYVSAAVLVPVVLHEEGPTVLLTRRSHSLSDHAGQISFPGGRTEPEDVTCIDTAIREAFEEIGLSHHLVDVVGGLPIHRTSTGFEVMPVVGVVRPPLQLSLDPIEVDEAFEVPLGFVLDPANYVTHRYDVQGQVREGLAVPFGDYFIWGATAGMLMSLRRALGITPPPG